MKSDFFRTLQRDRDKHNFWIIDQMSYRVVFQILTSMEKVIMSRNVLILTKIIKLPYKLEIEHCTFQFCIFVKLHLESIE